LGLRPRLTVAPARTALDTDMDELAKQIARKVVEETKYFTAIVGLIGVVVGSFLTIVGNIVIHWLANASRLRKMNRERTFGKRCSKMSVFREDGAELDTLMHVIGADEETTKRHALSARPP
jgi:hypothetical protein